MGEVIVVSLVGMVAFGGLFLVLCPEWWSTSLGTLKEKPAEKRRDGGDAEGSKTDT